MRRLRSIVPLAILCCVVTPGGLGRAMAGRPKFQPVGTINGLTEPSIRQVVQRRDDNIGNILVVGTFSGKVDGFQARSTLRPNMTGTPLDWTPLASLSVAGSSFVGIFRQPAGGFYDIQVRPMFQGQAGSAATVIAVGVGEVFITAGQSNATNGGDPTGFAPDIRVSSFIDGTGRGLDPAYPGASWRWGYDPQPAIDQSQGGSPWPTMASHLAVALRVPIGLYAAGCGGTAIEEWLPGHVKPATLLTPRMVLVDRLTNAINYFKVRSGIRGILWDQGETDFDLETNPGIYEAALRLVIQQTRAATGVPVKWIVAQTASPDAANPAERAQLEQAQAHVVDGFSVFAGPNTDLLGVPWRQIGANGQTEHFNASGLELLGTFWGIYVANSPRFLAPGLLPSR